MCVHPWTGVQHIHTGNKLKENPRSSVLARCRATMSYKKSFCVPWQRFYKSLEVYYGEEHHYSKRYSLPQLAF